MSNLLSQMLLIVRLRFEYYFYSFVKPETQGKFNNDET